MAGLRVWRPDGTLSFDGSASLLRYVGTFTVNRLSTGSVNIPEWADARPWFFTLFNSYSMYPNVPVPAFSMSGTTLSWVRPVAGTTSDLIRVYYGVY